MITFDNHLYIDSQMSIDFFKYLGLTKIMVRVNQYFSKKNLSKNLN